MLRAADATEKSKLVQVDAASLKGFAESLNLRQREDRRLVMLQLAEIGKDENELALDESIDLAKNFLCQAIAHAYALSSPQSNSDDSTASAVQGLLDAINALITLDDNTDTGLKDKNDCPLYFLHDKWKEITDACKLAAREALEPSATTAAEYEAANTSDRSDAKADSKAVAKPTPTPPSAAALAVAAVAPDPMGVGTGPVTNSQSFGAQLSAALENAKKAVAEALAPKPKPETEFSAPVPAAATMPPKHPSKSRSRKSSVVVFDDTDVVIEEENDTDDKKAEAQALRDSVARVKGTPPATPPTSNSHGRPSPAADKVVGGGAHTPVIVSLPSPPPLPELDPGVYDYNLRSPFDSLPDTRDEILALNAEAARVRASMRIASTDAAGNSDDDSDGDGQTLTMDIPINEGHQSNATDEGDASAAADLPSSVQIHLGTKASQRGLWGVYDDADSGNDDASPSAAATAAVTPAPSVVRDNTPIAPTDSTSTRRNRKSSEHQPRPKPPERVIVKSESTTPAEAGAQSGEEKLAEVAIVPSAKAAESFWSAVAKRLTDTTAQIFKDRKYNGTTWKEAVTAGNWSTALAIAVNLPSHNTHIAFRVLYAVTIGLINFAYSFAMITIFALVSAAKEFVDVEDEAATWPAFILNKAVNFLQFVLSAVFNPIENVRTYWQHAEKTGNAWYKAVAILSGLISAVVYFGFAWAAAPFAINILGPEVSTALTELVPYVAEHFVKVVLIALSAVVYGINYLLNNYVFNSDTKPKSEPEPAPPASDQASPSAEEPADEELIASVCSPGHTPMHQVATSAAVRSAPTTYVTPSPARVVGGPAAKTFHAGPTDAVDVTDGMNDAAVVDPVLDGARVAGVTPAGIF